MARILYFDADSTSYQLLSQILGSRSGHSCKRVKEEFKEDNSLSSPSLHEILWIDKWTEFDEISKSQNFDVFILNSDKVLGADKSHHDQVFSLCRMGTDTPIPIILVSHPLNHEALEKASHLKVSDIWIKPFDEPLVLQKADLAITGSKGESQVFNFSTDAASRLIFATEPFSLSPLGMALKTKKRIRPGENIDINIKIKAKGRNPALNSTFTSLCFHSQPNPAETVFKHQGIFTLWGAPDEERSNLQYYWKQLRRNRDIAPSAELAERIKKAIDAVEKKITEFKAGKAPANSPIATLIPLRLTWKKQIAELLKRVEDLKEARRLQTWEADKDQLFKDLTEFHRQLATAILPALKKGK